MIPSEIHCLISGYYHDAIMSKAAIHSTTDRNMRSDVVCDLNAHIRRGHEFAPISESNPFDMVIVGHLDFYSALYFRYFGDWCHRQKMWSDALASYSKMGRHLGLRDNTFVPLEYPMLRDKITVNAMICLKNMSDVHCKTNQFEKCIALCDEVLVHCPKDLQSMIRRAEALETKGDYGIALDAFITVRKVLMSSPAESKRKWQLIALRGEMERKIRCCSDRVLGF